MFQDEPECFSFGPIRSILISSLFTCAMYWQPFSILVDLTQAEQKCMQCGKNSSFAKISEKKTICNTFDQSKRKFHVAS